jgi:hypothetical protein
VIQEVNLYQPLAGGREIPISAELISKVCAAVCLGLVLIYAYAAWQAWRQTTVLETLRTGVADQSRLLQSMKQEAASREQDPALATAVQQLTEEASAKRKLLAVLSEDAWGIREGFSSHMGGLARQTAAGLWLKSIRIGDGARSLTLAGSARTPKAVPLLIEKLRDESSFAGCEFKFFRLERVEEGGPVVDFYLSSEAEEAS